MVPTSPIVTNTIPILPLIVYMELGFYRSSHPDDHMCKLYGHSLYRARGARGLRRPPTIYHWHLDIEMQLFKEKKLGRFMRVIPHSRH